MFLCGQTFLAVRKMVPFHQSISVTTARAAIVGERLCGAPGTFLSRLHGKPAMETWCENRSLIKACTQSEALQQTELRCFFLFNRHGNACSERMHTGPAATEPDQGFHPSVSGCWALAIVVGLLNIQFTRSERGDAAGIKACFLASGFTDPAYLILLTAVICSVLLVISFSQASCRFV